MCVESLLPSATEIAYALGLGDQLVGVTFECDEPPVAQADKTIVVGGRDTRGMIPADIDTYVWDPASPPAATCTRCTRRRSPNCGRTKLHRWANDDPHRVFSDLFNFVADPAFLLVAWDRVRGNKGARTPGVDGRTAPSIEYWQGIEDFLDELRTSLKDRSFRPLPVRHGPAAGTPAQPPC